MLCSLIYMFNNSNLQFYDVISFVHLSAKLIPHSRNKHVGRHLLCKKPCTTKEDSSATSSGRCSNCRCILKAFISSKISSSKRQAQCMSFSSYWLGGGGGESRELIKCYCKSPRSDALRSLNTYTECVDKTHSSLLVSRVMCWYLASSERLL